MEKAASILPLRESRICIVGLGYVGLPLSVEFGKIYDTVGFDIDGKRIAELKNRIDRSGEVSSLELGASEQLKFSDSEVDLADRNIFIVTVPTPVNEIKEPDLGPVIEATRLVGKYLKRGGVCIFESTVYPGVTDEVCGPILEELSGLTINQDVYLGYSPERVVPADKSRRFVDILKVTSGSSATASAFIDALYRSVVVAGTYRAESIKIAEAAKVIENTQRDVNIALINEFSSIFRRMGLDTNEVLNAASTKWNFIDLRPGLVGGHCIGVDPYYLIHQAKKKGCSPALITTARQINEQVPLDVSRAYLQQVGQFRNHVGSSCLIVGATFKPDCGDLRNSKVLDIVKDLILNGVVVELYDGVASLVELRRLYGKIVRDDLSAAADYDGIILCVDHECVRDKEIHYWKSLLNNNGLIFDIKGIYPKDETDFRL